VTAASGGAALRLALPLLIPSVFQTGPRRSADIPVCGFRGLSSPAEPMGIGDWQVPGTRRLESLRYLFVPSKFPFTKWWVAISFP
jgi:hypothetical protein